ncbi:MAG: tyrosine-type recombinase/integrase [Clostridia bacterium]|nr:tyrosine-type recombinase/integrase [Clostridia bacterium]
MGKKPVVKIHNKSDKPDNVVRKVNEILMECEEIERELPGFMRPFFMYLRANVLPMTRRAYLQDIRFFCNYLTDSGYSTATEARGITADEFDKIKARDINTFIDYCRRYQKIDSDTITIYENTNKTLARKKSSISVLFKFLFRDEIISKNITDGFDPIRVPKPGEREIKSLSDDEVMKMLDIVSTGEGLTKKQEQFWKKTKLRDKAILILFLTYGLRLSELQQLNISSFNFQRGEFKIYRKRGKESVMPINRSTAIVIDEYVSAERPSGDIVAEEDRDALFLSLQGKRMTERQIREMVKKYTGYAMGTSQSGGYSPHKLRATAATSLIGRGNSIFDVQALLDHENVTTTQLYAAHKLNTKRALVSDMEWELERKEGERVASEKPADNENTGEIAKTEETGKIPKNGKNEDTLG